MVPVNEFPEALNNATPFANLASVSGMELVKRLSATTRLCKLAASRPNSEGSAPENWLELTLSTSESGVVVDSWPSSEQMRPRREFAWTLSSSKLLIRPISVGREPVSALLASDKCCSLVMRPISEGIGPMREFPPSNNDRVGIAEWVTFGKIREGINAATQEKLE